MKILNLLLILIFHFFIDDIFCISKNYNSFRKKYVFYDDKVNNHLIFNPHELGCNRTRSNFHLNIYNIKRIIKNSSPTIFVTLKGL